VVDETITKNAVRFLMIDYSIVLYLHHHHHPKSFITNTIHWDIKYGNSAPS